MKDKRGFLNVETHLVGEQRYEADCTVFAMHGENCTLHHVQWLPLG